MESNRVLIAAILFILLIVGINLVMYGIVRGATKGGDIRWLSAVKKSFNKPFDSVINRSIDELRRKTEERESGNKNDP
jgi:hypothetical protein